MARLLVKELAEERHISMAKLSRISDVSLPTVRKLWHYTPSYDVSLSTLEKVANALHVHVTDLIEKRSEESSEE